MYRFIAKTDGNYAIVKRLVNKDVEVQFDLSKALSISDYARTLNLDLESFVRSAYFVPSMFGLHFNKTKTRNLPSWW